MHEYEYVGIQPGGLSEIVGLPAGMTALTPHMRYASYPTNRPGMAAWRRGGAAGSGYGYVGVGYPLQEIIGADPSLSGPTSQDGTMGPQVASVQPRNVREFAVGFGPTSPAVPAGATVIVAAQPQILFRGSRLVVPSVFGADTVAANFTINDIRVGKDSQFVAAGPLPAIAYLENAVGTAMGLDTCNVGQLITLNVTNVGAAPHTFFATIFGTSVQ